MIYFPWRKKSSLKICEKNVIAYVWADLNDETLNLAAQIKNNNQFYDKFKVSSKKVPL
jgi:hypothetical protein